ncbi:MAG: DUF4307 domain-containing protein [Nostocoides sp.]
MPLPRPTPGQGRWWVVGVIGIGLMVAAIVWLGIANTRAAVIPKVTAYQVTSDSEIVVDFDVHRPANTATTCTVVALDDRFGTVGTLPVNVPASSARDIHQQVVVTTTHRAVSADVKRCHVTAGAKE